MLVRGYCFCLCLSLSVSFGSFCSPSRDDRGAIGRLSLFRRPSVAAGALNATRGAAPWLRDRAVASG